MSLLKLVKAGTITVGYSMVLGVFVQVCFPSLLSIYTNNYTGKKYLENISLWIIIVAIG
ncbi:MAG: hypothetical protein FWH37_10160 [Candidatus Bathyarchaeota archaeon]|nr:hypothetical protein [Candidatus Termiticorpusculum sp.]